MTEKEFIAEYSLRLNKLVTDFIKDISSNKESHYNELFRQYIEQSSSISHRGNILISEIFHEYNLDCNLEVIGKNFLRESIMSYLYKTTISKQKDEIKRYDESIQPFLKEIHKRDFPHFEEPLF